MIPQLKIQLLFPVFAIALSIMRDTLVISGEDGQQFFIFFSLLNLITTVATGVFLRVHFSYFNIGTHITLFLGNVCLYFISAIFYETNTLALFLACLIFYFYSLISGYLIAVGHFLVARFHHVMHSLPFSLMLLLNIDVWTSFFWSITLGLALYSAYAIAVPYTPWVMSDDRGGSGGSNFGVFWGVVAIAAIPPVVMHGTQLALFSASNASPMAIRALFYAITIMTLPLGYLVYRRLPGLDFLSHLQVLLFLCLAHFAVISMTENLWLLGATTVSVAYCVRAILHRWSDNSA